MARKAFRKRELSKAKKLLRREPGYAEVVESAVQAAKDAETASADITAKRIRMPYVSANPLTSSGWK